MGLRSFLHRLTAPRPSSRFSGTSVKLVCVVNQGLKMGKGKLAAQVGHASVEALLKTGVSHPQHVDAWLETGQKKICVKVPGDEVMNELQKQEIQRSIPSLIVRDACHTQIPQGSQTVLALGPYDEDVLDLLTGDLKLL